MKDGGYINIQGWMITKLKLTGNDLILFALIYGFSQDRTSEFRGSITYIQTAIGVSRPTATKIISRLVEQKFIKKTKRNTGSTYQVDFVNIEKMLVKKLYHTSKETLPIASKETLPNIYNNNNKYNAEKISASDIFSFSDELEKMHNDPKRHINIIAMFMETHQAKLKEKIRDKNQLSIFIKRHAKSASVLSNYENDQLVKAEKSVKSKYRDIDWTLETLVKELTK